MIAFTVICVGIGVGGKIVVETSLLPSSEFLIALPIVVQLTSAPTSGERKKFSDAETGVWFLPRACFERYASTGAFAAIPMKSFSSNMFCEGTSIVWMEPLHVVVTDPIGCHQPLRDDVTLDTEPAAQSVLGLTGGEPSSVA